MPGDAELKAPIATPEPWTAASVGNPAGWTPPLPALEIIDARRRAWVKEWLLSRGLPVVETGSYYVKSFRPIGEVPEYLAPLRRDGLVRLCFKPPIVSAR